MESLEIPPSAVTLADEPPPASEKARVSRSFLDRSIDP
jgi:hypothetical protein